MEMLWNLVDLSGALSSQCEAVGAGGGENSNIYRVLHVFSNMNTLRHSCSFKRSMLQAAKASILHRYQRRPG